MNKLILFLLVCLTAVRCDVSPVGWQLPAEVYRKPDRSICHKVWSTEGSRCNGDALKKHAQHDALLLRADVDSYNSFVDKIKEIVNNPNSAVNQVGHEAFLFLRQFKDQSFVDGLKNMTAHCSKYLMKARDASLCYLCSNSYLKYFSAGKGIITGGDCGQMITNCLPFFHSTMSVISDLAGLVTIIETKGYDMNMNGPIFIELKKDFARFSSMIEHAQIKEILAQYDAEPSYSTAKASLSTPICARLFMLNKRSITSTFAGFLSFIADNINEIAQLQKNINQIAQPQKNINKNAKPQKNINNKKTGQRKLVLSATEPVSRKLISATQHWQTENLEADVAILRPFDNMIESFVGAKGTQESRPCGTHKPMNLSLTFP